MAKNAPRRLSSTRHNPDDDFDFNLGGDGDDLNFGDFGDPADDREPQGKFRRAAVEGFRDELLNPDMYKNMVRENFPDTYGKMIDTYDESVGALGSIYRAAGKAIKPAVKDLRRVAKLSMPLADKVLPKALAERVRRFSQPEKEYRVDEDAIREGSIKADLESVFAVRDKEAFQNRVEDQARENVKDGVEQIRHSDMIGHVRSITESTARLAAYQDNITINYQRKHLEITLRSYALQAEDSRLSRAWMETMRFTSEEIKKNTSLPDFVKRKPLEDLKAATRNRLVGKTLNMVENNTNFIRKWGDNISKKVTNSMNSAVSGFLSGAGMLLDQLDSPDEGMGMNMNELGGSLAGDEVANRTANWAGKWLFNPLKESKNPMAVAFRKFSLKLATTITTGKSQLKRQSQAIGTDESWWSKFLAATLPTDKNRFALETHTTSNLQEAAEFDVQSRRTLNEAIPGYFSRVLRELQIIRTGDTSIGLTRFDFTTGKFLGEADFKQKLFKSIVSDDHIKAQRYETDRMIDTIDPEKKLLSEQAREALHQQMLSDKQIGLGKTINEFMDPSKYSGAAATHAHQIAGAFRAHLEVPEGANYGNTPPSEEAMRKALRIQNLFESIGRYSGVDAGNIQSIYNSGNAAELEEMGIIKDGVIDNEKIMQYVSGELKYTPRGSGNINPRRLRPTPPGNNRPTPPAPGPTPPPPPAPPNNNRMGGVRRRQGGFINIGGADRNPPAAGALSPEDILPGDNPMMGGSRINGHQYGPEFSTNASKDIIDAIRANSTKSAVDVILEDIKSILKVNADSNEALWNIASGTGPGDIAGPQRPGRVRRMFGSVGDGIFRAGKGAVGLAGKGIGAAGRFAGRQALKVPAALSWSGHQAWRAIGATGRGLSSLNKWKKEVADVFFRDEVLPRLSALKISAGEYLDMASKKVIKSLKDIKGTVVDKLGNVILSAKEMLETYVKIPELKAFWEQIKQKADGAWQTLKDVFTGKINLWQATKTLGGKMLSLMDGKFQDVFCVNNLVTPLLKGADIRNGLYFKTNDQGQGGAALMSAFEITGPIVDASGNQVVTQLDITTGLCDKYGKPLKSRGAKIKDALGGLRARTIGAVHGIRGLISGTVNGVGSFIGEMFGATGFTNTSKRTTNTLIQIRNLLDDRLPGERIGYSDKDDFLPETSATGKAVGRKMRKAKVMLKRLFQRGKKAVDEKGGIKAALLAGFESIKGSLMNAYNKPRVKGDGDGDGVRDGSFADIVRRRKEKLKNMGKGASDKISAGRKALSKKWADSGMMGKLSGLLGGVKTAVTGLVGLAGSAASLFGMGGAATAATAATAGTAAAATAAGAGAATVGAGAAAAATTGVLGAGAAGAAAAGAGAATVGAGAAAAGAGAAGVAGAGLMATFGVPVLIVLGVAAAGYGVYRVGKWLLSTTLTSLSKLRMLQYGVDFEATPDHAQDLLKLEAIVSPALVLKDDKASLDTDKFELNKAMAIFGLDSKNAGDTLRFQKWFRARFLPIFGSSVALTKSMVGSNNPAKIDTAGKSDIKEFFNAAKVFTADFDELASPWSGDSGGWFSSKTNLPINRELLRAGIAKLQVEIDAMSGDKSSKSGSFISEAAASTLDAREKKQTTDDSKAPNAITDKDRMMIDTLKKSANASMAVTDQSNDSEKKLVAQITAPPNATSQGVNMADGALMSGSGGMKWLSIGKGVNINNIHPELRKNLLAMAEEYGARTGKTLAVTSGWRSTEDQARLYATMPAGKAAKPGTSLHEFGLAIDADSSTLDDIDKLGLMKKYGFTRPVGQEPWHVEPAGIQTDLDKFKRDAAAAAKAIDGGVGAGGGGYGTISSAAKYKRDFALAVSLLKDKASIGSTIVEAKRDDPIAGTNPTPPPAGVAAAKAQAPADSPVKAMAALNQDVQTSVNGSQGEQPPRADWGGGGYKNSIDKMRNNAIDPMTVANGGRYAQLAAPKGDSSNWSGYKELLTGVSDMTGVPVKWLAAKAAVESGFHSNVKNPKGSATGLFQFTSDTWSDMMGKYADKYGIPPGTPPSDARANALMAALYLKENQRTLAGVTKSFGPVEAYLGHLLGPSGSSRFFTALNNNPDSLVSDAVSAKSLNGNADYFIRGGKVLTVRESYDAIAANYLRKYADSPGVVKDLGPFEASSPGATAVATASPSSGASSLASSSTPVGYRQANRPTATVRESAKFVMPQTAQTSTRTDSAPSFAPPSMGDELYGGFNPARSPAVAQSNASNNDGAVAKNTGELVTVAKDQLEILRQIFGLMGQLAGDKSVPAAKSTPVTDTAPTPTSPAFNDRGFRGRPMQNAISMARSI